MPSGLLNGLAASALFLGVLAFVVRSIPAGGTELRKPDSRFSWLLEGVEQGVCLLMITLCTALPVLTNFVGLWPVASAASWLYVAALPLQRKEFPPLWAMGERTDFGKHAVSRSKITRSRWPFGAVFGAGNCAALMYVFTLGPSIAP